jgi:AcrR family transcriptional regulator
MAELVKPKFPRREQRARVTRRAVVDAASRLFVAAGYGGTTIQAIADEADVAVQTVYAVFGNKRSILAEVLDQSIAGDDEKVVVNARDWMRPVWEAPTAAERLQAYAAAVRRIMDGAGDVFAVVAAAAATDPDVVEFAQATEERRRAGATSVIDSIRSVGELRPGLTRRRAIDVLWLLNSPTVFSHFVRRAGWSPDQYQQWLADAMVNQLLTDDTPA